MLKLFSAATDKPSFHQYFDWFLGCNHPGSLFGNHSADSDIALINHSSSV
jgi:hypothetical protein